MRLFRKEDMDCNHQMPTILIFLVRLYSLLLQKSSTRFQALIRNHATQTSHSYLTYKTALPASKSVAILRTVTNAHKLHSMHLPQRASLTESCMPRGQSLADVQVLADFFTGTSSS